MKKFKLYLLSITTFFSMPVLAMAPKRKIDAISGGSTINTQPTKKSKVDLGDNSKALFCAFKKNEFNKVRNMIEAGVDPNAKDKYGWSLLHWAVKNGWTEIIEMLIEKEAVVDAANKSGEPPLHLAAKYNRFEIVKLLIDSQVKVDKNLLLEACGKCNDELLHKLLLQNSDNDIISEHGQLLFSQAVDMCNFAAAQQLLCDNRVMVDVNAKDVRGIHLLHGAISADCTEFVRLLIERGADVNAKDNKGQTPLHVASKQGCVELGQLLIERGADVNAKDNKDKTPLRVASKKGYVDLAQLLIERGADVNDRCSIGQTALHIAAHRGHAEIARQLINAGVDVNAQGNDGDAPFHFAAEYGSIEVARLLLERGANYNLKGWGGDTPLHAAIAPLNKSEFSLERAKFIALLLVFCDATIKNNDDKTAKQMLNTDLNSLDIALTDEKPLVLNSDEIDRLHLLFDGKILNKFKECLAIHKRRLPIHQGCNLTTAFHDSQIHGPAPINGSRLGNPSIIRNLHEYYNGPMKSAS